MSKFTRTEFERRLRAISKEVRRLDPTTRGTKIEIGERTIPVYVDHHPTYAEAHPEDDDLRNFVDLPIKASSPYADELFRHGAVIHLYYSSTGDWGELANVATAWLGTPDAEPELLHLPLWKSVRNYGEEPS